MFKRVASRLRLALVALASLEPALAAQDAPPRIVSLDEALLAADRLPDLRAAEAALRAAEAGIRSASRWPDPSVGFATKSITAKESYTITAPLPWPGRGSRIAVARAEAAISGADRDTARLMARRALRTAWFALAAREDMAQAATDRAGRLKATSDAVATIYDSGRVALLELSRARADAALAAAYEAQAEQEHRTAESVLRRLLGLDSARRVQVERPLPLTSSEPELDAAIAMANERSPVAKAAEARVKSAEASVRLASALRFPGISLEAGVDRNDPTQPGSDRSMGVSLTVPLGSGPALAMARADRDRLVALRDQSKREVADAVEQAWRGARGARLRYEALTKDGLPAAMQAAELAQLAYREGRADIFRVLDAERALAEARAGLAEAYFAWGVAHADLLNAIGEEER